MFRERQEFGLSTLPNDNIGEFEWTYPVYQYGSKELNELMMSSDWNSENDL